MTLMTLLFSFDACVTDYVRGIRECELEMSSVVRDLVDHAGSPDHYLYPYTCAC
jgi:hypothetical protein